jgi:hypothetical protein
MMNDGSVSQIAARLSLRLAFAFLALLASLHVLQPEFNSGHLISEYQLGDFGFMMSLAFCLLGASALLLALALGPRLNKRGERTGWWGLILIGAALSIAGVFPPVRTPLIIGYLHGIAGLVAIFGSPIAFTLIARSLARRQEQYPMSRHLRWATLVAWVGLCSFCASLAAVSFTGQMDTQLPPWVSLANRFLIVTYCIWFITAARSATRVRPAGGQTS